MNEADINQEVVRSLFEYDAATGILIRKPCAGTRWQPLPITHSRDPRGYLKTKIGRREYFVHRLVWLYVTGAWPVHEIDHVNRDASDNRYENLRDVPRSVNIANRRSWAKEKPMKIRTQRPNGSGSVELVKTCRAAPHRARVMVSGKRLSLGYFATAEEAWAAIAAHKQSTGQLPSTT